MIEPFGYARASITSLIVLELCLGVGLVGVTGYYHHMLSSYLGGIQRKILRAQFFNTYLMGIQMTLIYIWSLCMWSKIWLKRCTPNIKFLLKVWMFFCFLIIFSGFAMIAAMFSSTDALESVAKASLLQGIDLYYVCPDWKLLWDGLQYHKQCCGVNNYKDWMHASWMPISKKDECEQRNNSVNRRQIRHCQHVRLSEPYEDEVNTDATEDSSKTVLAPYACCKFSSNCYEMYAPVKMNDPTQNNFLLLSQINANGCLPLFRQYIWLALYTLCGFIIAAFLLNICLCCLTKIIMYFQNHCSRHTENDEQEPFVELQEDEDDDEVDGCENQETCFNFADGTEENPCEENEPEHREKRRYSNTSIYCQCDDDHHYSKIIH